MKLAIIPFLLVSTAASATGVVQNNDNRHNFGNTTHRTTNNVTNNIDDSNHSTSTSSNVSVNKNDANAVVNIDNTDLSFRSTNSSSDNSNTISFQDRKQAPSFGVYANGPCSGMSFAASVPGAGLGVGAIDEECSIRYAATLAKHLGEDDLALMLLYSLSAVKRVLEPGTISSAGYTGGWYDTIGE